MARDNLHESVKKALQKDGWVITDDPLRLRNKDLNIDYEVDLGAEKLFGAEKGTQKIAIEVKSFLKTSFVHEFHGIFGQYLIYQEGLLRSAPERILFLAVPSFASERLKSHPFLQQLIKQYRLKMVVFDNHTDTILEWKT